MEVNFVKKFKLIPKINYRKEKQICSGNLKVHFVNYSILFVAQLFGIKLAYFLEHSIFFYFLSLLRSFIFKSSLWTSWIYRNYAPVENYCLISRFRIALLCFASLCFGFPISFLWKLSKEFAVFFSSVLRDAEIKR